MQANRILWDEYRATWEAFSRTLDRLQTCVESGNKAQVDQAMRAVETAKALHSEARDNLAAALSDEIAAADSAAAVV